MLDRTPSRLYRPCRSSHSLHSIFILVLFTFVYVAAVTHVLSTAGAIIATQAPTGAW
jgi:hypothetical protein